MRTGTGGVRGTFRTRNREQKAGERVARVARHRRAAVGVLGVGWQLRAQRLVRSSRSRWSSAKPVLEMRRQRRTCGANRVQCRSCTAALRGSTQHHPMPVHRQQRNAPPHTGWGARVGPSRTSVFSLCLRVFRGVAVTGDNTGRNSAPQRHKVGTAAGPPCLPSPPASPPPSTAAEGGAPRWPSLTRRRGEGGNEPPRTGPVQHGCGFLSPPCPHPLDPCGVVVAAASSKSNRTEGAEGRCDGHPAPCCRVGEHRQRESMGDWERERGGGDGQIEVAGEDERTGRTRMATFKHTHAHIYTHGA